MKLITTAVFAFGALFANVSADGCKGGGCSKGDGCKKDETTITVVNEEDDDAKKKKGG